MPLQETLQNQYFGKPNLAMASNFEAIIRPFWSMKALE
jgi:hypothetical protein